MIRRAEWPALGGELGAEIDLVAERGVWGKVHGAASDYRWIAASAGIPAAGFGRQLYLGSEDLAESCFLWRALGDGRYLALALRPSPAIDAAGRSGFLERHVLLLRAADGAGAAPLALAAAMAVADWPRLPAAPAEAWLDPDFRLALPPLRLRCSRGDLQGIAEEGCRGLAAAVSRAALAEAYGGLLAGRRPVFLAAAALPAPAVAALLLPLPEDRAHLLSIAGGLPSRRFQVAELGQAWDLVGAASPPPGPPAPAAGRGPADQLAAALLDGRPDSLGEDGDPGPEAFAEPAPAPVEAAETAAPEWLAVVERFLADPGWRWLSPRELPRPSLLEEPWAGRLARLAESFSALAPPEGVDREHWQVKQEVVAALLLAADPGAGRDRFEPGRRVPALLFASRLDSGDWRQLRRLLGARFDALARQSLEVGIAARSFDRSRLADLDF